MSLRWKLNRLAAMDRREIAYRVVQRLHATAERFGVFAARVPPRSREDSGRAWLAELPQQFDAQHYTRAADRIIAGELDVFALRAAQLGFPPVWNRDPKTGRVAPLEFGKTLDYRDERKVGDIKYLWEPSRHAQLVTLAQAWHLSREPRYADACRVLLDSWIEQCPYPRGVHWTSSLEHAIRVINWSFAWHLLGGDKAILFATAEGRAFKERWLRSVFQHCHFIAGHFSRHSSANNHLLGELTGLFIAATTWPLWPQSAQWASVAQRGLEREALVQNGADGVNREQAVWYHHEVADMLLIAGLAGRANDHAFTAGYWQRLEAMLDFIASIMDVAGNVPSYGDADDAIIARLDPAPDINVYRSLLATGAILFRRADFKLKAGQVDDKTRWLLGDEASEYFRALSAVETVAPRREFAQAGYYVLGSAFETAREVRLVADAGPLGYLSIAAHGHADALSFTLSVAGNELLIDPGTFAYHTQRQWRDYFRGTAAHNTVRVDQQDQSVAGGNFLWLSHARARVIEFSATPQLDRLIAEHDGYRRLADPVTHRRELRLEHATGMLTVIDELRCEASHQVEIFWHFAPGCSVAQEGDAIVATANDAALRLVLPASLTCELARGYEDPPLGWVSPRFDSRVPSPTLVGRAVIHGTAQFVTQLQVSPLAARSEVKRSSQTDPDCAGTAAGQRLRHSAAR
ncbi:MAG TPA: alginate lyase family protein [Steroidobacteraceae bacterium]|nr:alginate lyase family protein [Steroidobacteraceae bacterium]